jgi:hypothetical protein
MSGKIDDTLLLKWEILKFFDELKERKDLTTIELERELERLFRSDERAVSLLLNILSRCREVEVLNLIAYALEYLGDESIVDPLIDMLLSPRTPTEAKLKIISILNSYGYDGLPSELAKAYPEVSRELDELARRNFDEAMALAEEDDEVLGLFMEEIEGFPKEAKVDYIHYLKDLSGPGVIKVLETLSSIVGDDEVAAEAIGALSSIESPRSISALKRVMERATSPPLKLAAEKAIRKLTLMGISPPEEPSSEPARPFLVILTPIDGNGDRLLWACKLSGGDKNKIQLSGFVINTDYGLKECYGSTNLSSHHLFVAYESLMKETNPLEVDREYAVKIIKDALLRNLDEGVAIPYVFAVWRQIFDGYDLTPERYEIDWDQRLGEITDENLLDRTGTLFYRKEFRDWYDHSDKAMEYYMKISNLKSNEEMEGLIKQYALEVFEPKRRSLQRSLELMADFLSMQEMGKADAKLAYAAASKLYDEELPLHEHPFVARMIEISLQMAGMLFRRRRGG